MPTSPAEHPPSTAEPAPAPPLGDAEPGSLDPELEGQRQRNYRETHQRIHLAALDLAEHAGLQHTTTAQIAEAAGVSRRTFFRYFSCKEQAVLPGHRRYLDAVDALDTILITPPAGAPQHESPSAILAAIDAVGDHVLSLEGDPELVVHRRVSALLDSEPELRAFGAAQDAEIAKRLAERLSPRFPTTAKGTLTLLAEVGITAWRNGWIRWSVQSGGPDAKLPAECHRTTRALLRAAFTDTVALASPEVHPGPAA